MTRYIPPGGHGPGDHWRRFRRHVTIAGAAAIVAITGALLWLAAQGPLTLHIALATALGVGGSVMLAGVLMALIFLSARSGMDEDGKGSNHGGRK